MASTVQFPIPFLTFIFFSTLSMAQNPFLPDAMVLPVTKDLSTLQYVTELQMGKPLSPVKLVIDLSGPFLWLDCASFTPSLSKFPVQSCSIECSMAKSGGYSTTPTVKDQNKTCSVQLENPISKMVSFGELKEGIVAIEVTDGLKTGSLATVPRFLFSCTEKSLLNGLGNGVKGTLGLGKSRISLLSQVSSTFNFLRKFSLCLSSSNGFIISGENHHFDGGHVSRSMLYTPLAFNEEKSSKGYYLKVNSIKINSKKLSISKSLFMSNQEGGGGTRISLTVPYTTMESTLYSTFTKAYIQAATAVNITRVSSMAPFGVCFSSKGVEKTRVGPKVPIIELVLQSDMVKWKIEGRNSMVHVSDEVMCLGFLDGGLSSSIVIGSYQLEDRFLEFNLGNSMLGFSASYLLMGGRSCSDLISNPITTL
ncbi:hypothetical protein M9H77_36596 [Catharanthus roseus]|uniref:Uncharacterized protein n=1 Tax=Catharanthus roseus TaxID=4058 RepID=A0ACB9ZUU7_CATRO|nr:hypothetical protein M9H77_36596 [Catharanthus roseus]